MGIFKGNYIDDTDYINIVRHATYKWLKKSTDRELSRPPQFSYLTPFQVFIFAILTVLNIVAQIRIFDTAARPRTLDAVSAAVSLGWRKMDS